MGVGSEVYCAVEQGRKGIGIELKRSYYNQAKKNLEALGRPKPKQISLFDIQSTSHLSSQAAMCGQR